MEVERGGVEIFLDHFAVEQKRHPVAAMLILALAPGDIPQAKPEIELTFRGKFSARFFTPILFQGARIIADRGTGTARKTRKTAL